MGLRSGISRLKAKSVWGPGGIGDDDKRVRGLLRVAFPALDISLFLFGAGGALFGIPALNDVFGPVYPPLYSATLALVAIGCLVGVGFPAHFWRVEQAGKAMLATLLTVYGGALVFAGFVADDYGRLIVAFVPWGFVPILIWRVFDVGEDAKRNGWKGAARGR